MPASPPEDEPASELMPLLLPEEPEESSVLPELDPLSAEASSTPLLLPLPELVLEDEEQAFVPIAPMPPIASRHAQKPSFFMPSLQQGDYRRQMPVPQLVATHWKRVSASLPEVALPFAAAQFWKHVVGEPASPAAMHARVHAMMSRQPGTPASSMFESPEHVHHSVAQHPSMHWSQPMLVFGTGGDFPASLAGQENVASSGMSHDGTPPPPSPEPLLLPPLLPELLPLLEPLPELEPEASPPEPPPVSLPASAFEPLLLPEVLEELEHAFVPIVPMPPIASRHAQNPTFFFMPVTPARD